jgi:formylmethanofuran dehydrogenase subunit E
MDINNELYKAGLLLHGHKCPAMPMGLRAGMAAVEALGVERAKDGQLVALVEIDADHCAPATLMAFKWQPVVPLERVISRNLVTVSLP